MRLCGEGDSVGLRSRVEPKPERNPMALQHIEKDDVRRDGDGKHAFERRS